MTKTEITNAIAALRNYDADDFGEMGGFGHAAETPSWVRALIDRRYDAVASHSNGTPLENLNAALDIIEQGLDEAIDDLDAVELGDGDYAYQADELNGQWVVVTVEDLINYGVSIGTRADHYSLWCAETASEILENGDDRLASLDQ